MEVSQKAHFVLVHGLGNGSWCWYKIADLLKSDGHSVTALDLASAGIHPADANTVASFEEYNRPLLDLISSLNAPEKVILVGHSHGGISISYAAEHFPHRVAAVVYVAARVMPFGLPFEEHLLLIMKNGSLTFNYSKGVENYPTSAFTTSESHDKQLYNRSPSQDVTLSGMLRRPFPVSALIPPDFKTTREGIVSVHKVYIKTLEDRMLPVEAQEKFIEEYGINEVEALDSDHSPFFSVPEKLHSILINIAKRFSV